MFTRRKLQSISRPFIPERISTKLESIHTAELKSKSLPYSDQPVVKVFLLAKVYWSDLRLVKIFSTLKNRLMPQFIELFLCCCKITDNTQHLSLITEFSGFMKYSLNKLDGIIQDNVLKIIQRNVCNIMAEGFRFMPLGLVGLRAFRLSAWVTWVQHQHPLRTCHSEMSQ